MTAVVCFAFMCRPGLLKSCLWFEVSRLKVDNATRTTVSRQTYRNTKLRSRRDAAYFKRSRAIVRR